VRNFFFPLLIMVASGLTLACGDKKTAGSGADEDVAAVVNGTNILVKDVDRVVSQQFRGQENQLSPLALAGYRIQSLDNHHSGAPLSAGAKGEYRPER